MKSTPCRNVRKQAGLSLKDVAGACRISVAHLSNIERGKCCPAAAVAERIARFYRRRRVELTEEQVLFPGRFG